MGHQRSSLSLNAREMIVLDYQAFSLVDDTRFRRLLQELEFKVFK